MTHKTSITGFASLQDAAEEIGRMRYDAISALFEYLMDEMRTQQMKDRNAKKMQLVDDSYQLIYLLGEASDAAGILFEKYKKLMQDEIDDDDGSSL